MNTSENDCQDATLAYIINFYKEWFLSDEWPGKKLVTPISPNQSNLFSHAVNQGYLNRDAFNQGVPHLKAHNYGLILKGLWFLHCHKHLLEKNL
jgi:hypothetical protein